jgi:hypothetical protein
LPLIEKTIFIMERNIGVGQGSFFGRQN